MASFVFIFPPVFLISLPDSPHTTMTVKTEARKIKERKRTIGESPQFSWQKRTPAVGLTNAAYSCIFARTLSAHERFFSRLVSVKGTPFVRVPFFVSRFPSASDAL